MQTFERLLTAVLVCVLVPAIALAKQPLTDWDNVVTLEFGTEIAVKLKSGGVMTGFLTKVTHDDLTIDIEIKSPASTTGTTGFSRTIDRVDVKEIRKAKGSRLASGLVGLAIGTGVGLAIGGGLGANSPSHEDDALLAGALGTLGGVTGAAIGAHHPFKGKKVYVAP